ncbi:hypothetical protein AAK684_01930 [Leptogranulimonas caecicola]|uniref:Uncharacterized protein n=1 Tax=Leptogranulimonas caecicola TaxID=2894156 RepID=A0AAU9CFV4_9ACTN|nr:hypothetical protein [Leptogranulimonas caecicola]BCV18776.1 hypothetical protein ATOBIA_N10660 [Atopobiaceae bacterium P1]BDC91107.1 hypothetical protein ATTO_09790 [Leptogranulimonas caecicola]
MTATSSSQDNPQVAADSAAEKPVPSHQETASQNVAQATEAEAAAKDTPSVEKPKKETRAQRKARQKAEKEEKARQRRIAARQGGRKLFPTPTRKQSVAFIVVLAVLFVGSVVFKLTWGSPTSPLGKTLVAQSEDVPARAAKGTTLVYKGGEYAVGTNLNAGQYKFLATQDRQDTSNPAVLKVNGEVVDQFTQTCWLTLSDGEQLAVDGATFVSAADITSKLVTDLKDGGTYLIGVDAPEGSYLVSPTQSSGRCTVYDSDAPGAQPIATLDVTAAQQVDVAQGQYLKLSGCLAQYQ